MPVNYEQRHRFFAACVEAGNNMVRMWDGYIGLALLQAFYAGPDNWVSAKWLADRIPFSDDTARRQLDKLVNIGRVACRTEGKTRVYRANERHANLTYVMLCELLGPHMDLSTQ